MGNYLKNELLARHLVAMAIKSIFSGFVCNIMMKNGSEMAVDINKVATAGAIFLTFYSILSLFQFCIKLTQNYLIGAVVGLVSLVGGPFLIMQVENQSTLLSLILVVVVFLLAIVVDIAKLITILKISD